jgi:hypothetical protein
VPIRRDIPTFAKENEIIADFRGAKFCNNLG